MHQGPERLMALLEQEVLGWWQRPLPVCLVSAPFGTRTVARGESGKVRMGNAKERLPEISICFELWLCLFSFLQRLLTLLWDLNQAG